MIRVVIPSWHKQLSQLLTVTHPLEQLVKDILVDVVLWQPAVGLQPWKELGQVKHPEVVVEARVEVPGSCLFQQGLKVAGIEEPGQVKTADRGQPNQKDNKFNTCSEYYV